MGWFVLGLAVAGNVLSNVMFKNAMAAFPDEISFSSLLGFAFNPFLWAGGLAAGFMLACYLFSLRDMGLTNTYATVTSLSLVGVTTVSALALHEHISLHTLAGVALVIGGIFLLSSAPHPKPDLPAQTVTQS